MAAFESTGTGGDCQRAVEAKIARQADSISGEDRDASKDPIGSPTLERDWSDGAWEAGEKARTSGVPLNHPYYKRANLKWAF